MLAIRDSQIRAFEKMVPETFYPLMLQHLTDRFYEKACVLGKDGLANIIEDGIAQGQKHDLETRYEYSIYIDHMVKLGKGFDSDILIPWAAEILKSDSDATSRMDALLERATGYEAQALEEGEALPIPVYRYMIESDYDGISDRLQGFSQEEYLEFLAKTWPKKHSLIAPNAFDSYLDIAKKKAKSHKVISREGVLYFMLIMFVFGQDFDKDKQYFWISNILTDPMYDEEEYKLTSVHFTIQKLCEALLEEVFAEVQIDGL